MSIGKHGVLTPDEARKLAKEELGKVARGADVVRGETRSAGETDRPHLRGADRSAISTATPSQTRIGRRSGRGFFWRSEAVARQARGAHQARRNRGCDRQAAGPLAMRRRGSSSPTIRPIFAWALRPRRDRGQSHGRHERPATARKPATAFYPMRKSRRSGRRQASELAISRTCSRCCSSLASAVKRWPG